MGGKLSGLGGSDMRVVDTETLRQLVADAEARGHSRLPSEEAMALLDEDGTHILSRVGLMFLPFARCTLVMKLSDRSEPVEVWMDLEEDAYKSLPSAKLYKVEL